jgi:hypothetical protein
MPGMRARFHMNWKTLTQLRTVKAFVEGHVFAGYDPVKKKADIGSNFLERD